MTFFALTVPKDRGCIVLTQDCAAVFSSSDDLPSQPAVFGGNYDDAYDEMRAPGSTGAAPLEPDTYLQKAHVIGRVAFGCIGDVKALARWLHQVAVMKVTTLDDAVDASALNMQIAACDAGPSHIFQIGYSEQLGRCAAFVHTSPRYLPVEVTPGHIFHPAPNYDAAGCDEILSRWEPSIIGDDDIGSLHRLVAQNVFEAWQARRLRSARAFGGPLHQVTVSCRRAVVESFAEMSRGIS